MLPFYGTIVESAEDTVTIISNMLPFYGTVVESVGNTVTIIHRKKPQYMLRTSHNCITRETYLLNM